jgi:hypothetical protein
MTHVLLPDEAKHLLRLCESGRLYEIEAWIRVGKSLRIPEELKKTPLGVALRTGFHSLIELLLRHEESQQVKNDALAHAVRSRRADLVELAVHYGVDTASVTFYDVLLSWDKRIMEFFLERGADFIGDLSSAHAFHERIRTALGVYLDCKRRWPELAPQLQEQADIALRQHCHDGNLRWVSLLMWAGADPTSIGPTIEYLNDDPEMYTTAEDPQALSGVLGKESCRRTSPRASEVGSTGGRKRAWSKASPIVDRGKISADLDLLH